MTKTERPDIDAKDLKLLTDKDVLDLRVEAAFLGQMARR